MKTKFYSAAVFCSALVLVSLVASPQSACAQQEEISGRVFSIDGSATLERDGRATPLAEGASLQPGDEVVTGEPGRVAIELQDGSYIRLASGSRMKLPKREGNLGLFSGALHFLSHTTKHPVIETQQITAAIRGTEFTLTSDKEQSTISMFSGVVDGASSTGKVHLTAGEGARFRKGSAPEVFAVLSSERSVQWSMFVPFVVEGPQSAQGSRAIELFRQGKSTEALGSLEAASKRMPCGRDALLRARILLSAGDPQAGSEVLERCSRRSTDPLVRSSAAASLANVKLMQGEKDVAEALSAVALKDAPSSASARLTRSFVLQERGDLDGALALVDGVSDPEGLARKAEILFMSGRVPEAREILEGLPHRSWYAESVYGFVLMADRDFADAEQAFTKAAAAAPGAALPRIGLGIVRVNRGDLAAARSQFEQATVLEPSRGLYRSYLAKAYFEDDQYGAAHPEYERAIELDPNDPTPYLYRSFMRVAENDLVGALDDITKARELSGYRNVYRSSFLLDQDSAMQSASVGRVYQQLGFRERGRIEAITALTGDYQNATAHRLLSHTQEDIFSADVIASEQRMANLFSPLSVNVVDSIGTNVSLNEYSQLFERDGWRTATNTFFDSQDDTLKTGILSAYKHENVVVGLSADGVGRDGIAEDPRVSSGTFGLSLQGQPSWANRYLIEAKGIFDGSTNSDESVDGLAGSASAAYLHKFSPEVTGLIQSSYSRDRETKHVPLVGDETFLSTVIDGGIEQTDELTALLDRRTKRYETTVNTEAQLIARVDRLTSILTLRNSSSDVDATDRNIILADELGELDGRGATLNSASGVDLSSNSASYLGDYRVVDSLHLQFGGEFETLEWATRDEPPLYSDSTRKDLWSPKAGIIFSPTREVTARVGYGETLGKGVRTDLISIEPTLIGGINQRYNDLVGTKSQNLGFGLDLHPRSSTFLGAEWNRRWLEEAATDAEYQYVQDYDLGEGYSTLAVGDSYYLPISQDLASAYAYEVLSRHWVIGTDYRYVRQDTNDPTAASRITHDHRSKAFTRYFFSGGLFLQGSATYRYQDRANVQIDSQGSGFGSDNAWFMGAGIGYRLPTRHGLILLDVQNIFGQDIALDQISYFNEPVFNDPTVQLAVNINF